MSRLRFSIASDALAIALYKAWTGSRVDPDLHRFAVNMRRFTPIPCVDSSRFALWPGFLSFLATALCGGATTGAATVAAAIAAAASTPLSPTEAPCACRGRRAGAGSCSVGIV